MSARFTTIGHSTRSVEEVIGMLQDARVLMLVDVRAFPRSRSFPAFNIDRFPLDLQAAGIGYAHEPALGGRRSRQAGVDPALNAMWQQASFHHYADYALGAEFARGLQHVLALGQTQRVALMCAEAVWWRCHRRIITDYLLHHGHAVDHLMGPGQVQAARLTPGAVPTSGQRLIYPAADLLAGMPHDLPAPPAI